MVAWLLDVPRLPTIVGKSNRRASLANRKRGSLCSRESRWHNSRSLQSRLQSQQNPRRTRSLSMPKPKVFVTRILPDAGLNLIREACDAEIWPEQLPPPYDLIKKKVAECDGL